MRTSGLRFRTAVSFAVGALLVASLMAVVTFTLARSYLIDQRERSATRQAFVNARLVRDSLGGPDPDVGGLLAGLRPDNRSEVAVEVDGEWYSTSVALTADSVPVDTSELLVQGDASRKYTEIDGSSALVLAVPLGSTGASYVEVFSLEELDRTLSTLRLVLVLAAALASAAGGAVGLAASRRVLRPLREVASTATEITEGDLNRRLGVGADPDLGPLSTAFNRMVDALQERIRREERFSSDVSHELRTPLAAMSAALSIARRREGTMTDEVRDAIVVLDEQLGAFQTLTTDLLEISRVDAGSATLAPERVDPVEFAEQVVADWEVGEVEVALTGPRVVVRVDKRRLRQAVINVLVNASKYAGGADRIDVVTTSDSVQLKVRDRGPGVPPEERETIFDRFARGHATSDDRSPRGSGLGLALAREHVELHGGSMWVEPREGGGATFVIQLPAVGSPT
jgi:two-component system sensor histidine kinase MtrB